MGMPSAPVPVDLSLKFFHGLKTNRLFISRGPYPHVLDIINGALISAPKEAHKSPPGRGPGGDGHILESVLDKIFQKAKHLVSGILVCR